VPLSELDAITNGVQSVDQCLSQAGCFLNDTHCRFVLAAKWTSTIERNSLDSISTMP
jgi:hypothetical protein